MAIKVQVTGNSPAADKLRGYLTALGYRVVQSGGRVLVEMIRAEVPYIAIEGVGELADAINSAIAELSGAPVTQRAIEGLPAARVAVPAENAVQEEAAARGVLRAILKLTGHGEPQKWFHKPAGYVRTLAGFLPAKFKGRKSS